jgi:hypothetical protein
MFSRIVPENSVGSCERKKENHRGFLLSVPFPSSMFVPSLSWFSMVSFDEKWCQKDEVSYLREHRDCRSELLEAELRDVYAVDFCRTNTPIFLQFTVL